MGSHRSIGEILESARRRIERYSPEEALAAQTAGAIIVDVRERADRMEEGAVAGAIPWPLSVLPWRADPDSDTRDDRIADRNNQLILMCNDGYSSSLAAAMLVEMGFHRAGDMDGGFHAWAARGLPVQPGD